MDGDVDGDDDQDGELFHLTEAPEAPARRPGERWLLAGVGAALVVVVGGLSLTLSGGSSSAPAAPATLSAAGAGAPVPAPSAPAASAASQEPATAAPSSSPAARSTGALGTLVPTPAAPDPVKDTSTPMPLAERAAAEAELRTFVAAHLRSAVPLTSPAAWAGQPADQVDPDGMASCPHLADLLGQRLGGRWTYTYGSLPGSGGCTWTPVPWVPDAAPTLRFFETVSFLPGADVRSADSHVLYQAAGTQCPEVDAPAVAPGAFAARCQDPDDLSYVLAVPDAGGRGLWYLTTYAGHAQHGHTAQQGLLALVSAVDAVY